jgi:hypothetical protein
VPGITEDKKVHGGPTFGTQFAIQIGRIRKLPQRAQKSKKDPLQKANELQKESTADRAGLSTAPTQHTLCAHDSEWRQ